MLTDEKIEAEIGMKGTWLASGDNNVYWNTARDTARFGLLYQIDFSLGYKAK